MGIGHLLDQGHGGWRRSKHTWERERERSKHDGQGVLSALSRSMGAWPCESLGHGALPHWSRVHATAVKGLWDQERFSSVPPCVFEG